jgi:signal transduction histidine kinase
VRAVERGQYSARLQWRWGPPAFRQLTSAFNTMTARLDANERQRRTLLADISHELRNPLTVLQGELEAMVDGVHPADTEHLEGALDETRVLARLIDDLRTLALAETDALPLHREPADLCVLVTEAADSFRGEAERAGVTLQVSVPADVPLVDVDPIRVREVLSNLIGNALRYAPATTAVLVSLRHDVAARAFEIEVVDHGPGIEPALRDHVFDRFVKSATSRGSGLGLAIARELVRAHGGRIEADATPGGGTTMRVAIPLDTTRRGL